METKEPSNEKNLANLAKKINQAANEKIQFFKDFEASRPEPEDPLNVETAEYKKQKALEGTLKHRAQLPQNNHTIREFAQEIAEYFKGDNKIFYKLPEGEIVEIFDFENKQSRRKYTGFKKVDAKRLLNIIESKVQTYRINDGDKIVFQSPKLGDVELLLTNQDFIDALNPVIRLLNYPLLFLDKNRKLITPKKGYDARFQAYTPPDTPSIKEISIEEAKSIIEDILLDFCFREHIDRVMGYAFILTPACRGLYIRPTCRTPLWILLANRERAGKDYLAGTKGIIYDGYAIDDNPISTGERNSNNNDELRKKITSAILQGRRLMHSANNKGHLNNAILEQALTSEEWRDRELGRNKEHQLLNEIEYSVSANIGITYTPDLWHRSRSINFFFGEEDPNERKFKREDLHGYIKENRGLILSAIYSIIKPWVEAGQPPGKTPFTSFPEWARVVGGIMQFHNLGDPCIPLQDDGIGGDRETQNMKSLFAIMANIQRPQPEASFTVSQIRGYLISAKNKEELEGFMGWDLENDKKDQTKLGFLVQKCIGRRFKCPIFTPPNEPAQTQDIMLKIANRSNRAARTTYTFLPYGNFGKVGNFIHTELLNFEEIINRGDRQMLPKLPTLPQDKPLKFLITYLEKEKKGELVSIQEALIRLKSYGVTEEIIAKALHDGMIFEHKPGMIKLLK